MTAHITLITMRIPAIHPHAQPGQRLRLAAAQGWDAATALRGSLRPKSAPALRTARALNARRNQYIRQPAIWNAP